LKLSHFIHVFCNRLFIYIQSKFFLLNISYGCTQKNMHFQYALFLFHDRNISKLIYIINNTLFILQSQDHSTRYHILYYHSIFAKTQKKNVSRIRKKTFYLLVNFSFLGSHDFRLHFRPHKVYFFELNI
jgi:hypothetical protein